MTKKKNNELKSNDQFNVSVKTGLGEIFIGISSGKLTENIGKLFPNPPKHFREAFPEYPEIANKPYEFQMFFSSIF